VDPFLRLPGELRIRIYALALSSHSLLHYCGPHIQEKPTANPSTHQNSKAVLYAPTPAVKNHEEQNTFEQPEFDQLQYVCKQLYRETHLLELRYNDITIARMAKAEPPTGETLFAWLATFGVERRYHLRKTRLEDRPVSRTQDIDFKKIIPDTARTFADLATLCATHTDLTIHYFVPGWTW